MKTSIISFSSKENIRIAQEKKKKKKKKTMKEQKLNRHHSSLGIRRANVTLFSARASRRQKPSAWEHGHAKRKKGGRLFSFYFSFRVSLFFYYYFFGSSLPLSATDWVNTAVVFSLILSSFSQEASFVSVYD